MQDILLPLDPEMQSDVSRLMVNENDLVNESMSHQNITISYPVMKAKYKKDHFTFLSSEALYTLVTEFKPKFLLENFSMGQLNVVNYETIFSIKNESIRGFESCRVKFKIKDADIKFANIKSLDYSTDGQTWYSENPSRVLAQGNSGG